MRPDGIEDLVSLPRDRKIFRVCDPGHAAKTILALLHRRLHPALQDLQQSKPVPGSLPPETGDSPFQDMPVPNHREVNARFETADPLRERQRIL